MKSSAVLELRGTLTEPVRGVRDVEISVHDSDDTDVGAKPVPWIGLVNGAKPVLQPSVFISHRDFDRVCAVAGAGLLRHVHLTLTEPRYNSAYVVRISFVTEPEE